MIDYRPFLYKFVVCYNNGIPKLSDIGTFYCECPEPYTGTHCDSDASIGQEALIDKIPEIFIYMFFAIVMFLLFVCWIRNVYNYRSSWEKFANNIDQLVVHDQFKHKILKSISSEPVSQV